MVARSKGLTVTSLVFGACGDDSDGGVERSMKAAVGRCEDAWSEEAVDRV